MKAMSINYEIWLLLINGMSKSNGTITGWNFLACELVFQQKFFLYIITMMNKLLMVFLTDSFSTDYDLTVLWNEHKKKYSLPDSYDKFTYILYSK